MARLRNISKAVRSNPLAIVGIYPPPYGGVGVHLKRMVEYLDKCGVDFVFYNTGPTVVEHPRVVNVGWSVWWLVKMLFCCSHKVIHFHTSRWWVRVLAACIHITRGTKIIFTAHGRSLPNSVLSSDLLKRILCRWALRQTEKVIATNIYIKESLIENGFPEDKIAVLPAFVPPPKTSNDQIPSDVAQFCNGHRPILMATGGFVLIGGQDVYGLRAMVDLVEGLYQQFPKIGLVVFLRKGAETHAAYFEELLEKIKKPPLSEHILFYTSKGEFYPALKICDVFLRPTTTDGDANSIREALYFGVPVIASDVIPRPEGCKLYQLGHSDEFLRLVCEVLENLEQEKQKLKSAEDYSAADKLIKIYKQLIGR
ncbi:MAG: glycosyltransferase [Desulfobacteraceae bacterium]|nr:glycosyltransferase [Desulfobacteraceae bacterium]